jgi:hypothetical protein
MSEIKDISEIVKTLQNLFGDKWGRRLGKFLVVLITGGLLGGFMAGVNLALNKFEDIASSLSKLLNEPSIAMPFGIVMAILFIAGVFISLAMFLGQLIVGRVVILILFLAVTLTVYTAMAKWAMPDRVLIVFLTCTVLGLVMVLLETHIEGHE